MTGIKATAMLDIQRLRRFRFLDSLKDDELEPWLDRFGAEVRPRNEIIFREGEPADRFYLLESGQVAAHRNLPAGGEQFLGYYVAGEFFGGAALMDDSPRPETVDAINQLSLLFLNKDDFLSLVNGAPAVKQAIDAAAALRARRRAATFPSKRPEEALVLGTHRHVIWFLIRGGAWSVLLLPLILGLAILGGEPLLLAVAIAAIVYVLGVAWFLTDWLNDWFVVSSRRVLHHERVIFFFEEIEEAGLDKIQNVTSEVPNVLAGLLDFGNVTIQTAAGGGRIVFDFVPRARQVRDAIESEIKRMGEHARQMEVARNRQTIRKELRQELGGTAEAASPAAASAGVVVQARTGALGRMFGGFHLIAPSYARKGDQVIWRKHVLLLLADALAPGLLLTGVMLFTLFMVYSNIFGVGLISIPVTLALAVIVTPLALFWLWYVYRDWENDIYVLTPDRLIDSERKPLWLQERVRVASLGQVQNVTFKRETFIQNVLNFGTVVIQTAGQDSGLTFNDIPNPKDAQAQISDALERFRDRDRQRDRLARRREFLDWFGEYHKLLGDNPPRPDPGSGSTKTPA